MWNCVGAEHWKKSLCWMHRRARRKGHFNLSASLYQPELCFDCSENVWWHSVADWNKLKGIKESVGGTEETKWLNGENRSSSHSVGRPNVMQVASERISWPAAGSDSFNTDIIRLLWSFGLRMRFLHMKCPFCCSLAAPASSQAAENSFY